MSSSIKHSFQLLVTVYDGILLLKLCADIVAISNPPVTLRTLDNTKVLLRMHSIAKIDNNPQIKDMTSQHRRRDFSLQTSDFRRHTIPVLVFLNGSILTFGSQNLAVLHKFVRYKEKVALRGQEHCDTFCRAA